MTRSSCLLCRKARVMCYCEAVESFESRPQFVILLHPRESRKAINTGRMAFRHLANALLLVDTDFTENRQLNELLADPRKKVFVLFPGASAIDLGTLKEVLHPLPDEMEAVFIIIDATWHMAKKIFAASKNLQALPQVSFIPDRPSRFFIREQPHPHCYSTIETIHYLIEFWGKHPEGEHHRMLEVFDEMVRRQIAYESERKSEWTAF